MERMLKKIFSMALLVSSAVTVAADSCCKVANIYSIRSQSENAARELAGSTGHVNLADMDRHYGSFSITPEYTRSFRSGAIAEKLFGCDLNCNKINIVGNDVVAVDATKDWRADYFYLPSTYTGSFTVDPQIQNALVDLNLYWGMDEWVSGMFFRVHAPITWTKWDLKMCASDTVGTGTVSSIVPNAVQSTFADFSCNRTNPADVTFSSKYVTNPLNYSRLCACDDTETRLSDIQMDFGWNFLLDDDYHLGIFARAAAPTGSKVRSELLFSPVVGNGHHWELGGGLTGHAILWRSEEAEDKHFGFYADANITHLFNAKQCRTFDLCDKPWSRYMLAFKDIDGGYEFSPIANLTAHEVKVSVGVQADVVAMFNYTTGNWGFDLGYNFWGRSCDKFDNCDSCDSCCDTSCNSCDTCKCPTFFSELDGKTWSIAGDTVGRSYSASTIHTIATPDAADARKYISSTDLDYVKTKGISHKIFTHFAYNWYDKEDWIPYLGIGGEVEFGPSSDSCDSCSTSCSSSTSCDSCCDSCLNTALSQWGIWVKGGFSF